MGTPSQFGGGGPGTELFGGSGAAAGGGRAIGGLREINQGANQEQSGSDRAQVVVQRQTRSFRWMKDNFYPEWEQVFKSYKCERNPEKKQDRPDEDDLSRTSVGMPDTWSVVRKIVARLTAQIPNLRFNAKDPMISELIGRTLMYQWDKAKVQRVQKRHCVQAGLFGWSVRPWYWTSDEYARSRRVNPMRPDLDADSLRQITDTYGVDPQTLQDPTQRALTMAGLLAQHSRGGMLPVKYQYKAYEGPKTEFLFVGDCFPEPNFTTLQRSNWFITERRWNVEKIEKFVRRFPDFQKGFQELMDAHPQGTVWTDMSTETRQFRRQLIAAIDRIDTSNMSQTDTKTREWTIQEQWVPGENSTLTLVGEKSIFLGEIENPYSLDGMIPFTEMVLIDDILSGIGDSTARIMRGLQLVHDRIVNTRMDLAYNLARPMYGTSDAELFENAEANLTRLAGSRLYKSRSQGDLWALNEGPAQAAMGVALNDESAIERQFQKLTGETNMSMAANVDPSQARTATGARIMAYNQDILTKDLVDAFNESSLNADAEMMYLLNRSELTDALVFQAGRYRREYTQAEDVIREEWATVQPEMFQIDGEITAEIGSTLADDDESKVTKATNLFQAAMHFPQHFNGDKASQDFLIAMGKGKELQQWKPQPQGPPPDPPANVSMTISAKWSEMTAEEKQAVVNRAHIQIQLVPPNDPELQPPSQQPTPPGLGPGAAPLGLMAGGPPPPNGVPPPPVGGPGGPGPEPILAASALAAAKGHSPLGNRGLPQ
jgi:hypothetical protein